MTLRHLELLIDIINKKIIEHFRLNIQAQITINLEKSQRHSDLLYTQKNYILLDFNQIL